MVLLGCLAEVVLFTAGLEDYAKPILDELDRRYNNVFQYRLYRPATVACSTYPCVKVRSGSPCTWLFSYRCTVFSLGTKACAYDASLPSASSALQVQSWKRSAAWEKEARGPKISTSIVGPCQVCLQRVSCA